MEKFTEKFETSIKINMLNPYLIKTILDYLPTQLKFSLLQNFEWNNKINLTLDSIFLESNPSNFKFKLNSNENIINEYLSPKSLFPLEDSKINNNVAKLLFNISKYGIRNKNNSKNLKYIPLKVSSTHYSSQSLINISKKYSKIYDYHGVNSNIYWSSNPTKKNESEFIILKLHPCLSFVNSLHLIFTEYGNDKIFNCKEIQISFGLNSQEYYYTTRKISIDVDKKEVKLDFNTFFLVNFIKIEFFEKNFKQFDQEENNYYICLDDLKIKGFTGKKLINLENNKFFYEKFLENKNLFKFDKITYYENLLFLNKNLFLKSEEFAYITSFFDNYLNDVKENKNEILSYINNYHKFLKFYPKRNEILENFIKVLNLQSWTGSFLDLKDDGEYCNQFKPFFFSHLVTFSNKYYGY